MSELTRLGILISGRGSNMEAIARGIRSGAVSAELALVISNVPGAPGLNRAETLGAETLVLDHRGKRRSEHDETVSRALDHAGVQLVCLAGYMRILSPGFVARHAGRVVNVHPSLLPAFPGMHAQRQALEHGAKVSGATVHLVDEKLDHGPIVLQEAVAVRDDDTEESLSGRILEVEHRIYPKAVDLLARGAVKVEGRRVVPA